MATNGILFAKEFIDKVKDGTKTQTTRVWSERAYTKACYWRIKTEKLLQPKATGGMGVLLVI